MALIWLLFGLLALGAAFVVPPQPGIEDFQQQALMVLACLFFVRWALAVRKLAKRKTQSRKTARSRRPKASHRRKNKPHSRRSPVATPRRKKKATKPTRPVLIDGSNVMHWKDGEPDIQVVQKLVFALEKSGYHPGVIFDANAGYKLFDRYLDDAPLAHALGLPEDQVLVSPKGQPADVFLLNAARDMAAPIVTNDRFRDWLDDFPEFAEPGRLIQGGYRKGAPYLKSTSR